MLNSISLAKQGYVVLALEALQDGSIKLEQGVERYLQQLDIAVTISLS